MPEVGYVGKNKQRSRQQGGGMPMPHNAFPQPRQRALTPSETLFFQLKEFEEFRHPSFNVLYVQTPRPELIMRPFTALMQVLRDTGELLRPILRLGIPESSLRDKLPYAREGNAPLPNSLRPRVQKLMKSNIEYAEKQEAIAQEWLSRKRAHEAAQSDPRHAKDALAGRPPPVALDLLQLQRAARAHEHRAHIPGPKFYTHEMPTWMVPALNLAAYWYLCDMANMLFKD